MKKEIKKKPTQPRSDLVILKSATNYLIPLLLMFSVFVLLRGHYQSGGGFVGGLVASIAFVLHSFANNTKETLYLFRFTPKTLIPVGLSLMVFSAILPVFLGQPIMTNMQFKEGLAIISSINSALLFDFGVYLVVIGVTLTILFTIRENV